ncbi:MAG: Ger(x)C family spore germination protein [Bacillota bacterium]|nr:Ger(x)C family spore germination protein [Bacillota bacterium]
MIRTSKIKKISCLLLCLMMIFPLGGCWSYQGINELAIVTGVAIDKDASTGNYKLTYEIVDLTKNIKQTGIQPKIVEAQGKTLLDANKNAKKRMVNKLYFGNTQVVIVSKDVAKEGISSIVDWFIRDIECRETLHLVVSQQNTAKELLKSKGIDDTLVASEINKIIRGDGDVTASTRNIELYDVFNTLKADGISVTLPAFHKVKNNKEPAVEVNGVGVFKKDRLIGFLTPRETNYYLFAINEIHSGLLTLSLKGKSSEDVSLQVYKNKTKVSCSYKDGKAKAQIKVKTAVSLDELGISLGLINKRDIKKIEKKEDRKLEKEIKGVIKKVQTDFGSDIFGFGNCLYKSNPKVWRQIRPKWDKLFKKMDVDVKCEITIINTESLIKN